MIGQAFQPRLISLESRRGSADAVGMSEPRPTTTRRQVLSALKPARISEEILPATRVQPSAGITVRLTTRAMACDFSVIMNPGPTEQIEAAGKALEAIHASEAWMSIYRENSEFSQLNRKAADAPQTLRGDIFELIQTAQKIHLTTDGAFDIATRGGDSSGRWSISNTLLSRFRLLHNPEKNSEPGKELGSIHECSSGQTGTRFDGE